MSQAYYEKNIARKSVERLVERALECNNQLVTDFLLSCEDATAYGGFDLGAEIDRIDEEDQRLKEDLVTVYEYVASTKNAPISVLDRRLERLKETRQPNAA